MVQKTRRQAKFPSDMNRKQEILEEISANYHGEDGIVPGNNLWLVAPEKLATYLAGLEERIAGQTIKSRVSDELVPVPDGFREITEKMDKYYQYNYGPQEKDDLESRFYEVAWVWGKDDNEIKVNKVILLDFVREEGERRYREGKLAGIEASEGVVEKLHGELMPKPRFPGGALERQITAQDNILHITLSSLSKLKEEVVVEKV